MRLIDADTIFTNGCVTVWECDGAMTADGILKAIKAAPTVDAIPIDTVAEMLADLFGDECACNYNNIDQTLAMGCERDSCPDDGDYSCWKKYIKYWMVKKNAVK